MMKKVLFIIAIEILLSNLVFCQQINKSVVYDSSEKFKVINKSYFDARVYIFTDVGACSICNDNISEIKKFLKGFKIEYVIFLNATNQELAEVIKNEYNWGMEVIGDEFGIYKAYYKIKLQPYILILNNDGIVLDKGKLGSLEINLENLNKIITIDNKEVKIIEEKKYLSEIKRINVTRDGKPVSSSQFREVLFDKKRNNYILFNNRSCNIIKIDSNGIVFKEIKRNDSINQICEGQFDNVTWAIKDSVIFLYFVNYQNVPMYHFYNIVNDNFTQPVKLEFQKKGNCNRHSYRSQFLENTDKFVLFWNSTIKNNLIFDYNESVSFIYNCDSKLLKSFDTPDPIYLKYKLSNWFDIISSITKQDELVTIQNFSNILKFWNFNGNLKKVINLELGNDFRKIDFDFKDTLSRVDAALLKSKISKFVKILYDESNNNYLISYINLTYPNGVIDYLSDEIIKYVYVHICDSNGNSLFGEDIAIKGYCYPFYFDRNQIFFTEINNNKLDIVIYKLHK